MCNSCSTLVRATDTAVVDLQLCREAVARQLCADTGIAPDTLRPNTLDEEPDDGILPCGAPGHFAWREMLTQADAAARRAGATRG